MMRIVPKEFKRVSYDHLIKHSEEDPCTSAMSASFLRKENVLVHYIFKGTYC